MNVVHIVGGDITRGAHRGAYWLHLGLRDIGVNSTIVGRIPAAQRRDDIVSISEGWSDRIKDFLVSRSDRALLGMYPRRSKWTFSPGLFGRAIARHPLIQRADVISIHWISNGLLGVRGFRELVDLGKPVVWTLRDMWPFTGGCHYSMECNRYVDGCGRCPQLGSNRAADLSRIVYERKERYISPKIKIVGISEWLSNCASRSRLLSKFDIRTIPNCIDTDIFGPVRKEVAKANLGIHSDKKILLIGAGNLGSFYKGFSSFVEAASHLDKGKVMALVFGDSSHVRLQDVPLEVRNLGYLRTDAELRLAYSAADVFVAPSRQEAFGKTLVEAMACGTPVVCFDYCGPRDIVSHKVTGYRAVPFDAEDLARGIMWVLGSEDVQGMERASLHRAVSLFDKKRVARKYQALYQEMIESNHGNPGFSDVLPS